MFSKSPMLPLSCRSHHAEVLRGEQARELPGKEVRHSNRQRRIIQPVSPRPGWSENHGPVVGRLVVRERILDRVQVVQKISAQLIAISRYPPHPQAPGERKAGAECKVSNV